MSLLATLLALLVSRTVEAAANDVCIPPVGGLGGLPVIDGNLYGSTGADVASSTAPDVGWNGAARVVLQGYTGPTPGASPNVWMQLGRDGSSVYMSLEVVQPYGGQNTTVVLAISTDDDPTHDWLIHVQPFANDDTTETAFNQGIAASQVWRNSAAWASASAPWLATNTRWSRKGSKWYLEMKIPIIASAVNGASQLLDTGVAFPPSATAKIFADIVSTSFVTSSAVQSTWPNGLFIQPSPPATSVLLEQGTPARAAWGTYSLASRAECDGVTLSINDIGVDAGGGAVTYQIAPGTCDAADGTQTGQPNNRFVAKPKNNSASTNAKVSATFRIAAWGIPSKLNFAPICGQAPGGACECPAVSAPPACTVATTNSNPTAEATIAPGTTGNLGLDWQLTHKQACTYGGKHECIEVDLDSSDPNTRFVNKSVQRNMQFGPASVLTREATISGDQGPLPPGAVSHHFLIFVEHEERKQTTPEMKEALDKRLSALNRGKDGQRIKEVESSWVIPAGLRFSDDTIETFGRNAFAQKLEQLSGMASLIARGFVSTKTQLVVRGKPYDILRSAGDFGVMAGHEGAFAGWAFDFSGAGVTKLADDIFELDLTPAQKATVTTKVEAVEKCNKPVCCLSRGGGGAGMAVCGVGLVLLQGGVRRRRSRRQTNG